MIRKVDSEAVAVALGPCVPSSSTSNFVSLKDYGRATIVITGVNGTTVTGSAISLLQATSVSTAATSKALSMGSVFANTNVTTASTQLSALTVTGDVFTCTTTDSKTFTYVIDVQSPTLDTVNGYDCLGVSIGNATRQTIGVTYLLDHARFPQQPMIEPAAD